MSPLRKVAIFLFVIGLERGSKIIELMDSHEINQVVSEIGKLAEISQETKDGIRKEFEQLGYEDKMTAPETMGIIRLLFNGSKISDKSRNQFIKSYL